MKQEEREEPTQLLDRVFLDARSVNVSRTKNLVDECKKMFETLPPQELLRSYLVRENRALRSPHGRRNAGIGTPEWQSRKSLRVKRTFGTTAASKRLLHVCTSAEPWKSW